MMDYIHCILFTFRFFLSSENKKHPKNECDFCWENNIFKGISNVSIPRCVGGADNHTLSLTNGLNAWGSVKFTAVLLQRRFI